MSLEESRGRRRTVVVRASPPTSMVAVAVAGDLL